MGFVCDATKSASDCLGEIFEALVDMTFDIQISCRRLLFSFAAICYREGMEPFYFDFNSKIFDSDSYFEKFSETASGASSDPTFDFNDPLNLAIEKLSCR